MVVRVNLRVGQIIFFATISALICLCLFKEIQNELFYVLVDGVWVFVSFLLIFLDILSLKASSWTKNIIVLSVIARLGIAVMSVLEIGDISVFLNQGDQVDFLNTALGYFREDYSRELTRYPYVINFIFHIFGPYRLMVQLVNIVFWYLGLKIIYRASGRNLIGMNRQLLTAFYCILPMQLLITSGIFRESIMIFFMMVSVYYINKYQVTMRLQYLLISILVAVPSILLHPGCIAIVGAIFFTYIMWNGTARKWNIFTWKLLLLFSFVVFWEPFYEHVVLKMALYYFPSTLSIESLSFRAYEPARADYVVGLGVANNVQEFIFYTLYRCVYFWISPTPGFWSSPKDIVGFSMDTIPWMIFLYSFYKQIIRQENVRAGWMGMCLFFFFTLIYAWGTRNAGTAMRHRDVLVGPMIMIMMYGLRGDKEIIKGENV